MYLQERYRQRRAFKRLEYFNKNVTEIFDGQGALAASYDYDPYGRLLAAPEPGIASDNPFRFSSEYADDELGLVYYNYRYYNPEDGRWTSRDPITEQGGWNLYEFVGNNPANNMDYLGLIGSEFYYYPDSLSSAGKAAIEQEDANPGLNKQYTDALIALILNIALDVLPFNCSNETKDKNGEIKCKRCCDDKTRENQIMIAARISSMYATCRWLALPLVLDKCYAAARAKAVSAQSTLTIRSAYCFASCPCRPWKGLLDKLRGPFTDADTTPWF